MDVMGHRAIDRADDVASLGDCLKGCIDGSRIAVATGGRHKVGPFRGTTNFAASVAACIATNMGPANIAGRGVSRHGAAGTCPPETGHSSIGRASTFATWGAAGICTRASTGTAASTCRRAPTAVAPGAAGVCARSTAFSASATAALRGASAARIRTCKEEKSDERWRQKVLHRQAP
jgi:hypothetical protein